MPGKLFDPFILLIHSEITCCWNVKRKILLL
jgi:hypothetical protein